MGISNTPCLSLSHVQLFATPWTAVHLALLSMEFSRILEWVAFSSPGVLPNSASYTAGKLYHLNYQGSHKGWPVALAENQTLLNCLEGIHDQHYTTNVTLYINLKYFYPSFSTILDHIWMCLPHDIRVDVGYILLFCVSLILSISSTHFYTCFARRIICLTDNVVIFLRAGAMPILCIMFIFTH